MMQQQHRGKAGVILAIGVASSLVLLTAAALVAVVGSGSLTDTGAALISTAIGTAIGALATYLGGNRATDSLPQATYEGKHREESAGNDDYESTES